MDPQSVVDRVDGFVVGRPGTVVLAFLLVSAAFAVGLGQVTTESGTDEFTTDVPAQAAFEDVDREFSDPFAAGSAGTSLIQHESNVLAKPALLRMRRTQEALDERTGLRVVGTSSPARAVARQLDPRATMLKNQIEAVERATPAQIDRAVRRTAQRPGFDSSLSNDFNAESATASAAIGSVNHRIPGRSASAGAGPGGDSGSPITRIQVEAQRVVETTAGDRTSLFSTGIVNDEFSRVIFDSLAVVVAAAALFILLFLVVAFRDPFDLVLAADVQPVGAGRRGVAAWAGAHLRGGRRLAGAQGVPRGGRPAVRGVGGVRDGHLHQLRTRGLPPAGGDPGVPRRAPGAVPAGRLLRDGEAELPGGPLPGRQPAVSDRLRGRPDGA